LLHGISIFDDVSAHLCDSFSLYQDLKKKEEKKKERKKERKKNERFIKSSTPAESETKTTEKILKSVYV
jgi:hypothetical protein